MYVRLNSDFSVKAAAIDRIPLSAENTPLTDDDDGDSEADIDSTPTSFKKPVLEEDIALAKIVRSAIYIIALWSCTKSHQGRATRWVLRHHWHRQIQLQLQLIRRNHPQFSNDIYPIPDSYFTIIPQRARVRKSTLFSR